MTTGADAGAARAAGDDRFRAADFVPARRGKSERARDLSRVAPARKQRRRTFSSIKKNHYFKNSKS